MSHHRGMGRFENLDAEQVRREYVSALADFLAPPAAGIPACHVHVSEAGLGQLVAHFAKALSMPLAVVVDEPAARPHTICGRRESWCFSLASNGERLRLHHADTGRAVSDLLFSRLLQQEESATQIFNWLMDALAGTGGRTGRRVLSIAGVRPRFAEFGRTAGLESWFGFDGRGGIIHSAWQAHPDALVALVLPCRTQGGVDAPAARTICGRGDGHQRRCAFRWGIGLGDRASVRQRSSLGAVLLGERRPQR
ncbi:hypothetical protein HUU39_10825 [candidate division KSB1 bacterium]|nr:hypothetical protein [candidate division KSB1 bacterium]